MLILKKMLFEKQKAIDSVGNDFKRTKSFEKYIVCILSGEMNLCNIKFN